MLDDQLLDSPRSRFRAAMVLAVAVDALQILVFPLFGEGALSPLDDVLDVTAAVALVRLIGWHWEFLPSFLAELLPGVDLVPFWTLAVVNVYRKWKRVEAAGDRSRTTALPGDTANLHAIEGVRAGTIEPDIPV